MRVVAGDTILLATASACDDAPCDAPTAGGATTLTVEFTADDRDGDGVADGATPAPTPRRPVDARPRTRDRIRTATAC
jgi:hypothetical protein